MVTYNVCKHHLTQQCYLINSQLSLVLFNDYLLTVGHDWDSVCSLRTEAQYKVKLTSFFPIVDTCLNCKDIARQSCAMVPRWRFLASFLRPVFSASHVQHISDLHSKFTLRPHHVWKYGRHPTPTAEIRRGNKKRRRKKERRKKQDENIYGLPYYTGRP